MNVISKPPDTELSGLNWMDVHQPNPNIIYFANRIEFTDNIKNINRGLMFFMML